MVLLELSVTTESLQWFMHHGYDGSALLSNTMDVSEKFLLNLISEDGVPYVLGSLKGGKAASLDNLLN